MLPAHSIYYYGQGLRDTIFTWARSLMDLIIPSHTARRYERYGPRFNFPITAALSTCQPDAPSAHMSGRKLAGGTAQEILLGLASDARGDDTYGRR